MLVVWAAGAVFCAISLLAVVFRRYTPPLHRSKPPWDYTKAQHFPKQPPRVGYRPDLLPPVEAFQERIARQSRDGARRVMTYCSRPAEGREVKGVVFLFPGLNEGAINVAHVANRLAGRGLATYSLDYPGYGESEGVPGYIESFDALVLEVLHFVDRVRRFPEYHSVPVFVSGLSLGGAMALRMVLARPNDFRGMVTLAPAITSDVHPFLQMVSGVVGTIFPRLPVVPLGPLEMSPSNLAVAERYAANVLFYNGKILARTGAELVSCLKAVRRGLPDVQTAFLAIHGTADMTCSIQGTRELYQRAPSSDKQLKELPGGWHALYHDPEWESVVALQADWILQRCSTQ